MTMANAARGNEFVLCAYRSTKNAFKIRLLAVLVQDIAVLSGCKPTSLV
jgi:hypothetical protein